MNDIFFATKAVVISCWVLFAQAATASPQCDCSEVVGQCVGDARLVSSSGTSPSFRGEIRVSSSESRCSKVEYYVDSTPYQTILVNKTSDVDEVFGTSPIDASSVSYSGCRVCKDLGANAESAAKSPADLANDHTVIEFNARCECEDGSTPSQRLSAPRSGLQAAAERFCASACPSQQEVADRTQEALRCKAGLDRISATAADLRASREAFNAPLPPGDRAVRCTALRQRLGAMESSFGVVEAAINDGVSACAPFPSLRDGAEKWRQPLQSNLQQYRSAVASNCSGY